MLSFYIITVVQIVLESLPVSSSGHIRLLEQLLNQTVSKELIYLLHIPTLGILAIFFCKPLFSYLKEYTRHKQTIATVFFFTVLIDAVTALFFIFFARYNPVNFLPQNYLLVFGFTITALLLYSLRWHANNNDNQPTLYKGIVLGVAQGCALLPGISRFATTYTVSCWLGFSAQYAFYVTWLVQAPLIAAAVAKTLCFSSVDLAPLCTIPYALILCLATVVGYYALGASYFLIVRDRLWLCAYYMIVPIILAFFCINYYTQTLF